MKQIWNQLIVKHCDEISTVCLAVTKLLVKKICEKELWSNSASCVVWTVKNIILLTRWQKW